MKPKKQSSKLQVALAMVTDIISPTNFVFFGLEVVSICSGTGS